MQIELHPPIIKTSFSDPRPEFPNKDPTTSTGKIAGLRRSNRAKKSLHEWGKGAPELLAKDVPDDNLTFRVAIKRKNSARMKESSQKRDEAS